MQSRAFQLLSKLGEYNNNIKIHIYLRANLTAQRPITKLTRERRKKQQTQNLQRI
jgi:hypothetical protein